MSLFASDLLQDKIAVVTGSGTGIGRVTALELARHGAHVVLAARQLDRLEEVAGEVRQMGRQALAVSCDISEPDQVKKMVSSAVEKFSRIDILVNNAAANFIRPTSTITSVRWKKVIDIVLSGTFYCTSEAGKVMLRQKQGRIISIVAAYAWTGAPGFAPSASAKAGIVALTRTLGAEWSSQGVLVNAIAPGPIDTPQTRERLWPSPEMAQAVLKTIPSGRFGTEKDVSNLILFLSSSLGENIAGEVIVSDGGQWLGKGALEFVGQNLRT